MSVVADLATIDLAALEELGPIVRVRADALRDPEITDAAMFGVLGH